MKRTVSKNESAHTFLMVSTHNNPAEEAPVFKPAESTPGQLAEALARQLEIDKVNADRINTPKMIDAPQSKRDQRIHHWVRRSLEKLVETDRPGFFSLAEPYSFLNIKQVSRWQIHIVAQDGSTVAAVQHNGAYWTAIHVELPQQQTKQVASSVVELEKALAASPYQPPQRLVAPALPAAAATQEAVVVEEPVAAPAPEPAAPLADIEPKDLVALSQEEYDLFLEIEFARLESMANGIDPNADQTMMAYMESIGYAPNQSEWTMRKLERAEAKARQEAWAIYFNGTRYQLDPIPGVSDERREQLKQARLASLIASNRRDAENRLHIEDRRSTGVVASRLGYDPRYTAAAA